MAFRTCCGPALVAVTVLFVGCEDSAVPSPWDGAHVLGAGPYPCSIAFEPTGVTLHSDVAGSIPDPGPRIARAPDGRLFTATASAPGTVVAWSADGVYLRTIGRPGDGPGELGMFVTPVVDDQGILHVLDQEKGTWHRFTAEGEFLGRTTSTYFLRAATPNFALIGGDSIVIAAEIWASEFQFHILEGDEVVHGFAALPRELGLHHSRHSRSVAQTGGRSFWVGPYRGGVPGGYVLEEWTFDGAPARSIRRDVPWFPPPEATDDPPSLPAADIHRAADDRLLAIVVRRRESGSATALEWWYELIDPEVPEVLASLRVVGERSDGPPLVELFPGTNLGFRASSDDMGLTNYEIVRYTLAPAPDAPEEQWSKCSDPEPDG